MDEIITPNPLPDGGNIAPAGGQEAVSTAEVKDDVVEVKDLMKTITGKEFPTNEAAIKSLQDTYKWGNELSQKVKTLENTNKELEGKQITPELQAQVATLTKQVAEANFFAANPQYNTAEAKALISKFGGNPEDVVKDEVFVKTFSAIKTASDMEQSQSVLHSNPRLGQAQDTMTKAVEAQKAGNQAEANANAIAAVLGAYPDMALKK